MNTNRLACLGFALLSAAPLAAGDFVNLDFEHPDLSHAKPDAIIPVYSIAPATEALRGWSLTADGLSVGTIYVTPPGGSKPPVALTGGEGILPGTGVNFGEYELYLDKPSEVPGSLQPIYHLSQLGTIPAGATELVYYRAGSGLSGAGPVFQPGFAAPFQIFINGNSVPYFEAGISYADVSKYAGQQVSLEFVFPSRSYFDIAGFTIAPEPSTYALFGLGAVALWWQCRRRSNS
jgi:hypothetical protein